MVDVEGCCVKANTKYKVVHTVVFCDFSGCSQLACMFRRNFAILKLEVLLYFIDLMSIIWLYLMILNSVKGSSRNSYSRVRYGSGTVCILERFCNELL